MIDHATAASRLRPSRILLLIVFLAFIGMGIHGGLLNVGWLYMQTSFSVPLEAIGVFIGASNVGGLLTTFNSGPLVKRFGMGPTLLGGSLLALGGVTGYSFAPGWGWLLVASCVAGMGIGLMDAAANTFVSERYSTGALNWMHAFYGVGSTIGPAIMSVIIVNLGQGWRVGYFSATLWFTVVALLIFVTLPRWRIRHPISDDQNSPDEADQAVATVRQSLRLPLVWLGMLFFTLYGGLEAGSGQLANNLFVEGRDIPQATAAFWISMYWGSFTVGRMLMGVVADRVPNITLIRVSLLIAVVGALLWWLNPLPIVGFLGFALLGLAQAPVFATMIALTPGRVGRRHAPNAIGFQVGITGIGIAVLPGLVAAVANAIDLELIGALFFGLALVLVGMHEIIVRRSAPLKRH